jgi:hypothetical protein
MDISKYCYSITFNRLRPCNDLMMNTLVDSLVYCGSGLSFYSRHAKNHFTIAAFFYNTAQFKPFKRYKVECIIKKSCFGKMIY